MPLPLPPDTKTFTIRIPFELWLRFSTYVAASKGLTDKAKTMRCALIKFLNEQEKP
jgi:hypothetical protein